MSDAESKDEITKVFLQGKQSQIRQIVGHLKDQTMSENTSTWTLQHAPFPKDLDVKIS